MGGTMDGSDTVNPVIPAGTYVVDRDINVAFGVYLTVQANAIIYFANSIGVQVQGQMNINGQSGRQVMMNVIPTPPMQYFFPADFPNDTSSGAPVLPGTPDANATAILIESLPVRIVGDPDPTRYPLLGLAMLNVNGTWGTICNRGWSLKEAVVYCGMMGLIVVPSDWLATPTQTTLAPAYVQKLPVAAADVRCPDWATDIRDCEMDVGPDQNCAHTLDLYLKCYPPAFAGVRYVISAQPPSTLSYASLRHGGMLDFETMSYQSNLVIEYNRHTLANLDVSESRSSGLSLLYADPLQSLTLSNSAFTRNLGAGVSMGTTYVAVTGCTMANNTGAGFEFNPTVSEYYAFLMRNWVNDLKDLAAPQYVNATAGVQTEGWSYFRVSANAAPEQSVYFVELRTDPYYRIVLVLLDWSPNTTFERIVFFDGGLSQTVLNQAPYWWRVQEELTEFPIISSSSVLTLRVETRGLRSGRLLFLTYARSTHANTL